MINPERLTEMQIGKTRIIFNYSYIDSVTEEQKKLDRILFAEAVENMCKPDIEEAV